MDQRKATKGEIVYPIIKLTGGQGSALSYLLANTKSEADELYQLIFDAGLVQLFQAAAQMHGEYLAEVATASREGDGADIRP